jgi:hypothetical protein
VPSGHPREPEVKTLCPNCGGQVYRTGMSVDGKIRYRHRKPQRGICPWHGTSPAGVEEEAATGVPQEHADKLLAFIEARRKAGRQTYVVTSAQNATGVHKRALRSLLTYCHANKAQLLVIPYRYRNPTSMWSQQAQHDDWWADELTPYLINHRVELNRNLVLLADIMTQPTASSPLGGFETITGGRSGIVGHPKLELLTVPTPQQKLPKILTTTGSVTKRNYIPSKAGKKGEFHHTFGACVVEVDGDHFHVRQLNMRSSGSFCDLLAEYDGDHVRQYDRVPALVMGDTHVEVVDPQVVAATFDGPDSIVGALRPEVLVWHDVFDGQSNNHHDRGRTFHEYVKHHAGRRNVEAEVDRTLAFIDKVTPKKTRNVFVASNHNDFLKEWVENTDPRTDPENVMFWAETYLAIVRSEHTRWTPSGVTVQDPFAYWGMKKLKTADQATFLRRDQPYQVKGIEVGYHGDRGPGGARGTRLAFSKIGVRSIIGHTHAPGIRDGAYQVGTSSRLDLTYAAGSPSAWLHCHCIVYPNGKRSLISVIEGEWKG